MLCYTQVSPGGRPTRRGGRPTQLGGWWAHVPRGAGRSGSITPPSGVSRGQRPQGKFRGPEGSSPSGSAVLRSSAPGCGGEGARKRASGRRAQRPQSLRAPTGSCEERLSLSHSKKGLVVASAPVARRLSQGTGARLLPLTGFHADEQPTGFQYTESRSAT